MAEAITKTGNAVLATELHWQGYGLGGVDVVRDIIDQNTKTVEGSRRFLFAKQ